LIRALLLAAAVALAATIGACSSNDPTLAKVDTDPEACATCHLNDFRHVRNPVHVGEKPTTCGVCHKQDGWHPSILNHPWTLTGAHAKAASCFECHKGEPAVFRGTAKLCFGCHAADYQRGPDHVAARYPTTCEECHSTTAWKPILANAKVPAKTPAIISAPDSSSEPTPTNLKSKPVKPKTRPNATTAPTAVAPDATTGASPRRH
jgi:hypothetical protein